MKPAKLRRVALYILVCLLVAFAAQIPIAWTCAGMARMIGFHEQGIDLIVPAGAASDAETVTVRSLSAPGARAVQLIANPPMGMTRRYLEHTCAAPGATLEVLQGQPWTAADIHPVLVSPDAWPKVTGAVRTSYASCHKPVAHREAAGWPMMCVEGSIDYYQATNRFTFSCVLESSVLLPSLEQQDAGYFCYNVRWPAYLMNTLIDGLILLILVGTVIGVRNRRRSRRTKPLVDFIPAGVSVPAPAPE